jgi:hypothetical protein
MENNNNFSSVNWLPYQLQSFHFQPEEQDKMRLRLTSSHQMPSFLRSNDRRGTILYGVSSAMRTGAQQHEWDDSLCEDCFFISTTLKHPDSTLLVGTKVNPFNFEDVHFFFITEFSASWDPCLYNCKFCW